MSETTTILIADDNVDDRLSLRDLLLAKGYRVLEAKTTDETFNQAITHAPDLIILDVEMPTEDGYSVCKQLRSYQKTSNIPILMLTCHGFAQERVEGLNSGADDYVIKPCDNDELLARVSALFRRWPPKNSFIKVIEHAQRGLEVAEGFRERIVVVNIDVTGSSIAPVDTNQEYLRTLIFHDYHELVDEVIASKGGSKVAWAGDGGTSEFTSSAFAVSAALSILGKRIHHQRVSKLTLRIGIASGLELLEPSSEVGKRTSQTHNRAGHFQKYSNTNKVTIDRDIYDSLDDKSLFRERTPISGLIAYESA
jgi:DNA-binding response OmpR family regulator